MALWEISVYEDRDPDGNGEEHQCPSTVLFLSKHRFETVGAPEGSDRVACEVNVDGRAYDRDEDDGVVPGEIPLEEGNPTGDQERVRDQGL